MPRRTAGQLSPPLPIKLDCLLFLPCGQFPGTHLILAVLSEQLPGGVAGIASRPMSSTTTGMFRPWR